MIVLVLIANCSTITFAQEKNIIELSIPPEEKELFHVVDIEIDGHTKTFDEENGFYIFTPKETETLDILSEPEIVVTFDDTLGLEKIEEVSTEKEQVEKYLSDMASSNKVDLTVSNLTATTNLVGGQLATFEFEIANLGTEHAENVELGIKVDNSLVGIVNLGTIEAPYQYTGHFNINGVPAGSHMVEIVADINNKILEFNESNNTTKGTFVWSQNSSPLPDLSAQIISPKSGSDIDGPKDEMDTTEVTFKFYNNGGTMPSSNFYCTLLANDNPMYTFSLGPIKAYSSITGTLDIAFETYGEFEFGIQIDSSNIITESNEQNNIDTAVYNIVYCTHFLFSNGIIDQIEKNEHLKVRIETSAVQDEMDKEYYRKNLFVWNNIIEDIAITNAIISDELNDGGDIVIWGVPVINDTDTNTPPTNEVILGHSVIQNKTGYIKLATFSLSLENADIRDRTLKHELGHIFGLAHPNNLDYFCIMNQTKNDRFTTNLTNHDRYNLIKAYE